jgi:hypothetical protein
MFFPRREDVPPEIFVNSHAEMLASFSTKGDDADGHKSTQTESRRIEGQAEEIYDLRRLRAAVEEKTRIEILFEIVCSECADVMGMRSL